MRDILSDSSKSDVVSSPVDPSPFLISLDEGQNTVNAVQSLGDGFYTTPKTQALEARLGGKFTVVTYTDIPETRAFLQAYMAESVKRRMHVLAVNPYELQAALLAECDKSIDAKATNHAVMLEAGRIRGLLAKIGVSLPEDIQKKIVEVPVVSQLGMLEGQARTGEQPSATAMAISELKAMGLFEYDESTKTYLPTSTLLNAIEKA